MTSHSRASFSPDDLRRVRTETFVREVEHHTEIGSTNDRALELCGEVSLPVPYVILADRQSAGRGRGSNRWWSGDGALLFSLIIDAADYALPESRWPQLSLTAGVAVCETLHDIVSRQLPESNSALGERGRHSVGLKWPNDVWLNGRKACGILVEVPPVLRGRLVIGVGLNVNNSFESAPPELHSLATSLHDETGQTFDGATVLSQLLRHLDDDLKRLAVNDSALVQRWQSRCVLRDQMVSLDTAGQLVIGRCLGIAEEGALRLQLSTGEQRFHGGIVRRIEPGGELGR